MGRTAVLTAQGAFLPHTPNLQAPNALASLEHWGTAVLQEPRSRATLPLTCPWHHSLSSQAECIHLAQATMMRMRGGRALLGKTNLQSLCIPDMKRMQPTQHTAKPLCFQREQQKAGSRARLDAELQTYHGIGIAHSPSELAWAHSYRNARHSTAFPTAPKIQPHVQSSHRYILHSRGRRHPGDTAVI